MKNSIASFQNKKEKWVRQWVETVLSTYPSESAQFYCDTADPFSNPVGATVRSSLSNLYDALVAPQFNINDARHALQPIVKLRAVQDFSPSRALGFVYELKEIVVSGSDISSEAYMDLSTRIDKAMLVAFDLYMENKKTIYTLRAKQARDTVRQLLIKKDLICELPEIDPELSK